MIEMSSSGSTSKMQAFLQSMVTKRHVTGFEGIAQRGVAALQAATPVESGLTASSWSYVIESRDGATFVSWVNTNSLNGANVAILIQYGHGTGTGGYVSGQDFINPAIRPIFDELANESWKKVTSA